MAISAALSTRPSSISSRSPSPLDIPQTSAEFPSCFNYPKDRGPAYLGEKWWAQKIVEASGKPGWKWQWLEVDENGCYAGIKSRSMTTQADDELAEVTSALA
ncbi:hypothetical protein LTR95_001071 [Oleoguttula sp. CCFEE 5521]